MIDRPRRARNMAMVRKANFADLPFILSLSRDSFSRFGRYELTIAKWFCYPGTCTFVYEKDEERGIPTRCGFIMLAFIRSSGETEPVLEVMAISVSEEHRRQGIGGKLMARARQFSESLSNGGDTPRVRLSVAATNQAAFPFFRKCGFTLIGEAPWRYPAGQKALRMEMQSERDGAGDGN